MALSMETLGQKSLFEHSSWRTTVRIDPDHRLAVLCKALPWEELMEKAVPILYAEQGIREDLGRPLNLRAHLGIYILQTVHNWSDRWSEEMLKFYIPARLFCGFLESEGSLDHTSIEEFRNRFGEKGAQLISHDMIKIAKEFGFTKGDDVDMDTTVQEAGITHPTEMKLMNRLMEKANAIHQRLKNLGNKGISGMRTIAKQFSKIETEYRFFAKTKEKKDKIVRTAVMLSEQVLGELSNLLPGTKRIESLNHRYQQDILKLLYLGPRLLEQIMYWLKTGKVAKNKIISLWKLTPTAIGKGKIGKPVEFGRKWIVNAYQGGYVLLTAPANPKFSDQNSVLESLSLHSQVFANAPTTYAADRGMWGGPNLELCLSAGVKKIAIQPKGKSEALVSRRDLQRLSNRRAGIEARIAHLKTRGLGTSRMKTDTGDLISGYRSALSYNLTLLMRDLSFQPALATNPRC
jgi:transposase, IS5 family